MIDSRTVSPVIYRKKEIDKRPRRSRQWRGHPLVEDRSFLIRIRRGRGDTDPSASASAATVATAAGASAATPPSADDTSAVAATPTVEAAAAAASRRAPRRATLDGDRMTATATKVDAAAIRTAPDPAAAPSTTASSPPRRPDRPRPPPRASAAATSNARAVERATSPAASGGASVIATDDASATTVERTGVRLSRATTTPTRDAMTSRRQISASVRRPGKRGLKNEAGGVGTAAVADETVVAPATNGGGATAAAAVFETEEGDAWAEVERAAGGRTPTPEEALRPKSDAVGAAAEPAPEKTISYVTGTAPGGTPPVDDKAAGGPDGKRTPTRAAAPIAHSRSAHTGDAGAPSPLAPPPGEVGAVTPTAEGGGGEEGARRVARPPPTQWERAARRGAAAAAAAATDAAAIPTAGRSARADDARRHDGRVTAGAAMRAANAGTGRVVSGRANRRFGRGGIATDDRDGAGGRQGTHQRSGAYA